MRIMSVLSYLYPLLCNEVHRFSSVNCKVKWNCFIGGKSISDLGFLLHFSLKSLLILLQFD